MKAWILQNQLARRNLEVIERVAVVKELETMVAAEAKKQQGRRTDLLPDSAKGVEPIHTRNKLADMAGVSHYIFFPCQHGPGQRRSGRAAGGA